jgi:phosphoadenosine phosphosulfate reductase
MSAVAMTPDLLARIEGALVLLQRVAVEFRPAVLASSLGAEDMVLTDMIAKHRFGIGIFMLDTGRLHAETLGLLPEIARRYGKEIRGISPAAEEVNDYVARHGLDAFYDSVELRKRCCEIRKVEPLRRALAGKRAWITGMRRGQSASRSGIAIEETDAAHGLRKFNPLSDWSGTDVWNYLRYFEVPRNPLHDQGYASIGCAPCTRPVAAGEDPRAGRWWWEAERGAGARECGIHFSPEGKIIRVKATA